MIRLIVENEKDLVVKEFLLPVKILEMVLFCNVIFNNF